MRLTQIIEALLFASDAPLSAADLSRVDERLDEDTVEAVIQELRAEYELSERSFQIYEVAGGYQLLTRPEFVTVLERYDSVPQSARLSAPALEVLAIIAYRQPLGRAEIEDIRGVGSSGVLRTLQERSLIEPVARGEGLGRPLLYGTTNKFLEHFGFRSLEDLPRPDELPVVLLERTEVKTLPLEDAPAAEAAPEAAAESATAEAASGEASSSEEAPAGEEPAAESGDESAVEPTASANEAPAVGAADEEPAAEAAADEEQAVDASDDAVVAQASAEGESVAQGTDEEPSTETHVNDEAPELDEVAERR